MRVFGENVESLKGVLRDAIGQLPAHEDDAGGDVLPAQPGRDRAALRPALMVGSGVGSPTSRVDRRVAAPRPARARARPGSRQQRSRGLAPVDGSPPCLPGLPWWWPWPPCVPLGRPARAWRPWWLHG